MAKILVSKANGRVDLLKRTTDIAVIGGGASAMAASIEAARRGAAVLVLERGNRVGRKLLATGNGRCNLTNKDLHPRHFHGKHPGFAKAVLKNFGLSKTLDLFLETGVLCMWLESGRMYPRTLMASSVLDMLRCEMKRLGVTQITDFFVTKIEPTEDGFLVKSPSGEVRAKRVIVAAGGCAAPAFGTDGNAYTLLTRLGHRLIEPVPSLVQLKIEKPNKSLKGIRHISGVSLFVDNKNQGTAHGEIQFTEYGLSGPGAFDVSREAAQGLARGKKVFISLNLLPDYDDDKVKKIIMERCENLAHLDDENFLNGIVNKRLGMHILKIAKSRENCAQTIKSLNFQVIDTTGFENAQTTAGGIDTSDFIPETMESKKVASLYAAGEILDIDGDCGGYNLQWAWSSGAVAGGAAAESIRRSK